MTREWGGRREDEQGRDPTHNRIPPGADGRIAAAPRGESRSCWEQDVVVMRELLGNFSAFSRGDLPPRNRSGQIPGDLLRSGPQVAERLTLEPTSRPGPPENYAD